MLLTWRKQSFLSVKLLWRSSNRKILNWLIYTQSLLARYPCTYFNALFVRESLIFVEFPRICFFLMHRDIKHFFLPAEVILARAVDLIQIKLLSPHTMRTTHFAALNLLKDISRKCHATLSSKMDWQNTTVTFNNKLTINWLTFSRNNTYDMTRVLKK